MTAKVVTLGAGYFAAFQHEAWTRLPGAELVAIADADPAKAQAAAKAAGTTALPDLAALLDLDPDIVDICIPPDGHSAAVQQALAARPRVIICQKPFCTSIEEAQSVADEAEAAGVALIVHENFRFQPWWQAIGKALEGGLLGRPFGGSFRLRTGDGQGPHAYLDRQPYFQTMKRLLIHETGVHYIDTFRYLFGDPTAIWAETRRLNPVIAGEDAAHIIMDHPGDVRSLLDANRLADHATQDTRLTFGEAVVEGEDGDLTLLGDGRVLHRERGSSETRELLGADRSQGFAGDCVLALQAHVVAHLETGAPLQNIASDYMVVMHAKEAAYRSASKGRKIALQ